MPAKCVTQGLLKSLSALSLLRVTANCAFVVRTVSQRAVKTLKATANDAMTLGIVTWQLYALKTCLGYTQNVDKSKDIDEYCHARI